MILLIPEINYLNFSIYFILSFICQVKAYRMEPFLYTFRGKINLLELGDYFSFEDYVIIRSEAVRIWQNLLPKFPRPKWKVKIETMNLDFSNEKFGLKYPLFVWG